MINLHCVYTHISPSGNVYVGQSNNPKRRWGTNGEHYMNKKKNGDYVQKAFARAILKYGWKNFEHKIILENINKKEADYAEKYLIKWYKLHHQSYNITDGGEGTCGVHKEVSLERRKAVSKFMRTNHPMKGKHHTPEAIEKIIAASKNRVYTEEQKAAIRERCKKLHDIPITDDTRKKLSDYRKAHPETWIGGWNAQEVHQYDLEGSYVASYSSAMEAAEKLGKNINSQICSCLKGKVASAGGYFWRINRTDSIDISQFTIVKTKHGARIYKKKQLENAKLKEKQIRVQANKATSKK